jgi:hypothetical protein
MRSPLRVLLVASCAAIVVAGCGTKVLPRGAPASKAPSSSTMPPSARAAVSPRQRAEADAAAIRASFVPPPGARRLTAAPGAGGGALKQPFQTPGTPDLVDDASWWLAPGQPVAVLAWEKAHLPARFTSAGTGTSSYRGADYAWSDEFSLPEIPAVLNSRELLVEAVSAGHGQTAIRVDSQVTWLPAKLAAERVPATAASVTLSAIPALGTGKRPAPVTVTNRDKVRRIAALADALPLFPPGVYNCPMDDGQGLKLTFRGPGGQTLAVMSADETGCTTVSFTVGGKSLPVLWDGDSFARHVLAVAGLHWPGSNSGGGSAMQPGG